MRITAIEIRQKKFAKGFRGYQVDEVDAFLYSMAQAWEQLATKYDTLKEEVTKRDQEIERLEALESALLQTIKGAEYRAEEIIEQAEKKAVLLIEEGRLAKKNVAQQASAKVASMEQAIAAKTTYVDVMMERLHQLAKDILQKVPEPPANS